MKYNIVLTSKFKREYKVALKRGYNPDLMKEVIVMLAEGKSLPAKNKDHSLSGNLANHRECHIEPDWLLIYKVEEDILVLTLTRTGTHSDLF